MFEWIGIKTIQNIISWSRKKMSNKRPHELVEISSDDDEVVCLDEDTPKREYGERPNKRLHLDAANLDATPGTSSSFYGSDVKPFANDVKPYTKDVKPFAEVKRCFEKLKVVFPSSNRDYLEEQAEHLAGDEGAFTQFVVDNVDQELIPPNGWVARNPLSFNLPNRNPSLNDINFKTLVDVFPTVCPEYLMGIVNFYDNDGGTQIRSWWKEVMAKGLEGTLPTRRDFEDRWAKRHKDPVEHFKELRELLPRVDPDYIRKTVEQCGGSEKKKNEWVLNIMENNLEGGLPTIQDYERRKRKEEMQGVTSCPFCPHYIFMHSSPEENNIFKCDE